MNESNVAAFAERQEDDPELPLDIVRDTVREGFPEFAARSVEHLGSGWSFDAYLVDDAMLFKFPRHAAAAGDLDRIDRIQTVVASAVGTEVGIPKITLWGTPSARFPHRFVGHLPIRGVGAWGASEKTLELADDIGHALALIHAIPALAMRELDLRPDEEDCQAALDQARRKVQAAPEVERVAPTECEWLSRLTTLPNDYAGVPRVVHGDLVPRHLIVSETTGRLSGIIDWTPMLGDPAQDFSWLFFCRNLSFVRRALDTYRLDVDAAFLERTIFFARCRALDWVAGAMRTPWGPDLYLPILRRAFATD
ncbi:MAG TPA: aminoglycoside phosphotransferase family protein [Gemmatimonadaceae bacterium]|jgi:aminoglycoside phosphotransferase (APT) family kinase protein